MPFTILAPVILILCVAGGLAPMQDLRDAWPTPVFQMTGYLLRQPGYPP